MADKKLNIWFDFSNPPHVNLFLPLLRHFEQKGISTHATARDFVETKGLLNKYGIDYQLFGNMGARIVLLKFIISSKEIISYTRIFQNLISIYHPALKLLK